MLLIGWTTKVTEYSRAKTMPANMTVIITTTKPQILTSISSGFSLYCWLDLNGFRFNFLLQYRGYQILRTGLCKLTSRFLTLSQVKVIRILAGIAIPVFTGHQQ
jgi:hypothetical protein